ncbi:MULTISPECIES: DUF982 domain-containing protein [Neorhizobium]|jgi:hypothetical protein|uniref:DUF982 domain-containing protein n=1 Tax=Neorhizobium sp. T6_25 TaxID=2093833 RepID=UPI000CFA65AB|nr:MULTISPECIES: DUF982 domain-containing protein [Neorhizobium]
MSIVIETKFDVRWREPVWVKTAAGTPEAVRGPRQALQYLTRRSPVVDNAAFDRAKHTCVAALRKEASCDAARQSFITATRQAHLDA